MGEDELTVLDLLECINRRVQDIVDERNRLEGIFNDNGALYFSNEGWAFCWEGPIGIISFSLRKGGDSPEDAILFQIKQGVAEATVLGSYGDQCDYLLSKINAWLATEYV